MNFARFARASRCIWQREILPGEGYRAGLIPIPPGEAGPLLTSRAGVIVVLDESGACLLLESLGRLSAFADSVSRLPETAEIAVVMSQDRSEAEATAEKLRRVLGPQPGGPSIR